MTLDLGTVAISGHIPFFPHMQDVQVLSILWSYLDELELVTSLAKN